MNRSISISDSFWFWWGVVNCWEHSDFTVTNVSLPEVLGFFGIWKFHQESHDVISTSIWCFIPFSETWVMILVFHVGQTAFRASVILSGSVISVSMVASEPFFKSHGTHDIIIGHGVKTVECAFDFLFRTNTALEGSGDSSVCEAVPVHDLFFFETPWLEQQCIDIIRFDKFILHWSFIEEENLKLNMRILCWSIWTNLSIDIFPKQRQFWVWTHYYIKNSPCLELFMNLPQVLKS